MSRHHRAKGWDARKIRPIIAKTLPAPCVDCGRPVYPTQRWQVGHRIPIHDPRSTNDLSNLGPSHTRAPGQRACNQIAGGRMGAAIQGKTKRDERRLPSW